LRINKPAFLSVTQASTTSGGETGRTATFFFFFIALGLELSDTKVYEPYTRDLLGTTSQYACNAGKHNIGWRDWEDDDPFGPMLPGRIKPSTLNPKT